MSEEPTKAALKEAFKEWMDAKLAEFGWWSIKTIGMLLLCGVIWLALTSSGWHK
jgi:hypothetical protein